MGKQCKNTQLRILILSEKHDVDKKEEGRVAEVESEVDGQGNTKNKDTLMALSMNSIMGMGGKTMKLVGQIRRWC